MGSKTNVNIIPVAIYQQLKIEPHFYLIIMTPQSKLKNNNSRTNMFVKNRNSA